MSRLPDPRQRDPWRWVDGCRRDAVLAWRTLTRAPGFTLVAVLTLAIAIGANTIVFTVTNAVLFKGVPWSTTTRASSTSPPA